MGRPHNPARRTELLEQLLAFTAQQPLARLSFRTIATELGVSTYTLVYHFGTRRELIDAILQEAMATRLSIIGGLEFADFSRGQMTSALRTACRNSLAAPHRPVLRLQFEGIALEGVDPDVGPHVSATYRAWSAEFQRWLTTQGVPEQRATTLTRLMIDTVCGVLHGHLITDEWEQSVEVFDTFLDGFMELVYRPVPARAALASGR